MPKNLMRNTSFEIFDAIGFCKFWVMNDADVPSDPNTANSGAYQNLNNPANLPFGSYSGRVYNPPAGTWYLHQGAGVYGIRIQPSTAYTFSYYHYYDINNSGRGTDKDIAWFDVNGSLISVSSGGFTYAGTTWSRPQMTATSPANAYYAQPRIGATSSPPDGMFFDGVQLEEGSSATVYERSPFDPVFGTSCLDYQYIFRSFLFGSQTYFVTEKMDGLLGMPSVRDGGTPRDLGHGSVPGYMTNSDRIIAFDLKVDGTRGNDINAKLAFLRTIFQAQALRIGRTEESLYFKRPGEPIKYINVRCTRRDFPSEYNTAAGLAAGSVELQATDPTIYSAAASAATITATSGNTVATAIVAPMLGDSAEGAFPTIIIPGPSTNPIVGNTTDDSRSLKFLIALSAGHSIRVNLKTKKVEKNIGAGYVEDYTIVKSDNQWWSLRPGANTITYNRTAGNTGANSAVTLAWSDTWA